MLNDSDRNILAGLRHEACEAHCWDCLRCIEADEDFTVDRFGQATCSDCADEPHDLGRCDCDACDEDRAEARADGRGTWGRGPGR